MTAADRADLRAEVQAQQQDAEAFAILCARADARRASPHWPFAQLTPMQQRAREQQEQHLRDEARRRAEAALW